MNPFVSEWINQNSGKFDSMSDVTEFNVSFNNYLEAKDWDNLQGLFKKYPSVKFGELKEYADTVQNISSKVEIKKAKVNISEPKIHALLSNFHGDSIFNLKDDLSYNEVMEISETLRLEKGEDDLAFIVSNNIKLEGKITSEMSSNKLKIDLVNYYVPARGRDPPFTQYFGQPYPKIKPKKSLSEYYYSYDLEANHKKYLLLSKEKIEGSRISVEGMLVVCSDKVKGGNTFMLPSNVEVVFVNSWKNDRVSLTQQEVRELFPVINHEELATIIFGKFRHPLWFERLVIAFLFSGLVDNYPMHLCVAGPPATGKTKGLIEPLTIQIPDPEPMVYHSTNATFKAYIPSYGGGQTNMGALLSADRICYADEFLSSLVNSNNSTDAGNMFGKLTSLLEWSKNPAESGYGMSISCVHPTMQLLACTNFQKGFATINEAARKLNNAAMSRIVWYVQNKEHIEWIKERASEIMSYSSEERLPKRDDRFVKLYDFFKSKHCKVDHQKVKKLYNNYREIIPDDMSDVYLRYDHHLFAMIDGMAKYLWLTGQEQNFDSATEKAYELGSEIFENIISSWISALDFEKMNVKSKVRALTTPELAVFNHISYEYGINTAQLEKALPESSVILGKLQLNELIGEINGGWYPYWHSKMALKEMTEFANQV